MKFWNKKKIERSNWTKVMIDTVDYNKERLIWCKKYPSTGRFYRYYGNYSWWFENEQDAIVFTLRWA